MKRLLAIGLSLAFVTGAAACGGGGDAGEQQGSATGQKAAQQEPGISVSDSELRSFVEASFELESFREEMRSRMQQASGQEEGQKVRKKLMQERDSIIEDAGLSSTARFDSIAEAIKSSERLRKRYTKMRQSVESERTASDTAG